MEGGDSATSNDFPFSHFDDAVDGGDILVSTTDPLQMCTVCYIICTAFLFSISSGLLNNVVGYTRLSLLPSLYTESQILCDLPKAHSLQGTKPALNPAN